MKNYSLDILIKEVTGTAIMDGVNEEEAIEKTLAYFGDLGYTVEVTGITELDEDVVVLDVGDDDVNSDGGTLH